MMPRRFHPRFSLRTLTIIVTLVCVYFAAWEVTKRKGVEDVRWQFIDQTSLEGNTRHSPFPFFVQLTTNSSILADGPETIVRIRRHFLWFFGWTWETPIRWEVANDDPSTTRPVRFRVTKQPRANQPIVTGNDEGLSSQETDLDSR